MRRPHLMGLVMSMMLMPGCSGCNQSHSSKPPVAPVSGVYGVASDAITKVAWVPAASNNGTTIQARGFGLGPSGEIVIAGGYEDQSITDQPTFVVHDEVDFYDPVAPGGVLNLTKTAHLPKALARPNVVTVGSTLFVLGGYVPSTNFAAMNESVWRYEPATNSFAVEADDPEPGQWSYVFSHNGAIYRLTPPYQPRQNPVRLGSVGRLQSGGTWINKPLSDEISRSAAVCLFQGKIYVFGGTMLSAGIGAPLNTAVFEVDLDSAVVTRLNTSTLPRVNGAAFAISEPGRNEVLLLGGMTETYGGEPQRSVESFSGGQVSGRSDLRVRHDKLSEIVVSGDFMLAYDETARSYGLFKRN